MMLVDFLCLILSAFLLHVSTQSPMILNGSSNLTVPIGSSPISLMCTIDADDMAWFINDTWYNQYNGKMLQERGFTISQLDYNRADIVSGSVMVDISPENNNNNTVIECRAVSEEGTITPANTATLLIADVPLPPSPLFVGIDGSTIGVEWEVPFTWEDFPVLNYTLEVINQTNTTVLDTSIVSPDVLSYNITRNISETSCTNISFSVQAISDIGSSAPGIVYGAFPTAPGMFVDYHSSEVTLTAQGTTNLDISFTFPFLCPYYNATYFLLIKDDEGVEVYRDGPHTMHWNKSGSNVTVEVREGNFQLNMDYVANITVRTIVGQSDTQFRFNTSFMNPTSDALSTADGVVPYLVIVSSAVAGVVGLCILGVVILLIGLAIRRKSCRRKQEMIDVMVPNPLYGEGVIYEEIPCKNVHFDALPRHVHEREEGYVSITPSGKITNCPLPLTPQDDGYPCKDGLGEDTYTVMKSAGTCCADQEEGVVSPYYNIKDVECVNVGTS